MEPTWTWLKSWVPELDLGGWVGVVSAALAFVGFLKYRSNRKTAQLDRDLAQEVVDLNEALFHIDSVLVYLADHLSKPGSGWEGNDVFQIHSVLTNAGEQLRLHAKLVYGIHGLGENALLRAARHYRESGRLRKASLLYEKILYYSGKPAGALAVKTIPMSRDEVCDCYRELQECYLGRWNVEKARRLARQADAAKIDLPFSDDKLRNPGYALIACSSSMARFRLGGSRRRRHREGLKLEKL